MGFFWVQIAQYCADRCLKLSEDIVQCACVDLAVSVL